MELTMDMKNMFLNVRRKSSTVKTSELSDLLIGVCKTIEKLEQLIHH